MSFLVIGGMALSIGGGIYGASEAKSAQSAAAARAASLEAKLADLEANRQAIIDPYENVESLAGLAVDLSNQISNPFANLGVATKAADIQIEEADIALANTLDTLRATGASAGGATALAQAALRSKKDVAASIETQEAQNLKLRAKGEDSASRRILAEKSRVQGIQISEGAREQNAEAMGKAFMFGARDNRENQQLDRTASLLNQALGIEAQAGADKVGAVTSTLGSVANMLPMLSDRRAKTNINKIGVSPSGLNIYTFEYKDKSFGKGVFEGVMSDEIPKIAVINHADSFDRVDYSKLDVEFKQV